MPPTIHILAALMLIALCGFAGFRLSSFLRFRAQMNARIPGPPGGLLLGNMKDLISAGGFNDRFFDRLHEAYGDIVRFWLLGKLNVSVRDPKQVAEVHVKAPLRPLETKKILAFLGDENLLFMTDVNQIKAIRQRFLGVLNGKETWNKLVALVEQRLQPMCERWSGNEVDVHEEISGFLYHVNGTIFFGPDWMTDPRGAKIHAAHETVLEEYTRWAMTPIPAWYNANYRKFRRAVRDLWKHTDEFVEAWRKALESREAGREIDLLSMLLTAKSADGGPEFTSRQITTHVIGVLNGSFDTTRATLTWVLARLSQNPELQDRLRAEIQALRSNSPDISMLKLATGNKLLDAVIQESMRLISTVPVIQRVNYAEDVRIDGITVPRGTTINLPYQQTFQVPQPFAAAGDDPAQYCPSRFLGNEPGPMACRVAHTPFGSGSRHCVGSRYALVEIRTIITRLLLRFSIEPTGDHEIFAHEVMAGVSQPSGPVRLRFNPLD